MIIEIVLLGFSLGLLIAGNSKLCLMFIVIWALYRSFLEEVYFRSKEKTK